MAAITATTSSVNGRNSGLTIYNWETLTESDTATAVSPNGGETLAGAIQFIGTFGGATIVLQGSNNGTNWVTLKDVQGTAISTTATAAFEFSTAMAYLRVSASGGTSQNIDSLMAIRGT